MPDPAVHAPDLRALRRRGAKRDPRVQAAVEGEHVRPYRIHASEHVLREGGAAVAPQRLQRAHVPLPRRERRFRARAVAPGADARLVRPRGARAGRKRAQQRGREHDRDAIRRRGSRRETRGAGHGGAARSSVRERGGERRIWLGREKTKRRGLRKFARVFAQPRQLSNPPRSRSEETGLLQLEPRPRHPAEERIVEREVNPGRG